MHVYGITVETLLGTVVGVPVFIPGTAVGVPPVFIPGTAVGVSPVLSPGMAVGVSVDPAFGPAVGVSLGPRLGAAVFVLGGGSVPGVVKFGGTAEEIKQILYINFNIVTQDACMISSEDLFLLEVFDKKEGKNIKSIYSLLLRLVFTLTFTY